jgi:hypothetical protein
MPRRVSCAALIASLANLLASGQRVTALADLYHQRLVGNSEVLARFQSKYGVGAEMIARPKIGFADNNEPSIVRALNPPQQAIVLCVDEKSQPTTSALSRESGFSTSPVNAGAIGGLFRA